MLDAKPEVGVLVERPLLGGVHIRGFEAGDLVAIRLRQLDAAVPFAVFDVATSEDDEPCFQLLGIEEKGHWGRSPCRFRVRRAPKCLILRACAEPVCGPSVI